MNTFENSLEIESLTEELAKAKTTINQLRGQLAMTTDCLREIVIAEQKTAARYSPVDLEMVRSAAKNWVWHPDNGMLVSSVVSRLDTVDKVIDALADPEPWGWDHEDVITSSDYLLGFTHESADQ